MGCFVVSWKTLMSCGSAKGGEEILDGFELKVMDEKESSITCQNDQRISEVSEEWLSCFFG